MRWKRRMRYNVGWLVVFICKPFCCEWEITYPRRSLMLSRSRARRMRSCSSGENDSTVLRIAVEFNSPSTPDMSCINDVKSSESATRLPLELPWPRLQLPLTPLQIYGNNMLYTLKFGVNINNYYNARAYQATLIEIKLIRSSVLFIPMTRTSSYWKTGFLCGCTETLELVACYCMFAQQHLIIYLIFSR